MSQTSRVLATCSAWRCKQVTSPWRLLFTVLVQFQLDRVSLSPPLPLSVPFPQTMTAVLSPSNPLRKDNIMATLDGDLIG